MNKKFIELTIMYPSHSITAYVNWIEVESPTGSFVVCPNHNSLVSLVKENGTLSYQESTGKEIIIPTASGIFRILDNKATLVLTS